MSAAPRLSRGVQVMNLLGIAVFGVLGIVILARSGRDALGAALFCLGISALCAVAWWFRQVGTKRAGGTD